MEDSTGQCMLSSPINFSSYAQTDGHGHACRANPSIGFVSDSQEI